MIWLTVCIVSEAEGIAAGAHDQNARENAAAYCTYSFYCHQVDSAKACVQGLMRYFYPFERGTLISLFEFHR
jgi:hypothetical protein